MALLEAVLILVVGYLVGTITRMVATVAAVVALLLAVLGLAAPQSFFDLADPVLRLYAGNELLFLAGFLFAIGHQESSD
jgi:hypothetical protein